LRWINAALAKSVQILKMILFFRPQPATAASPEAQPDTVRAMAAAAEPVGLWTVPAAWPAGVSQLAIAIDACQRCDPDVCSD